MRRALAGFVIVLVGVMVLPLLWGQSATCNIARAQETPCLAQEATISALRLENLELRLTAEAGGVGAPVLVTVMVIITATPEGEGLLTGPTVTPGGPVLVRPARQYDEVNVRSRPNPDAPLAGTLAQGETVRATGRFFRWLQIEFEAGEEGRAWVFESVVNLEGDPASLPDVQIAPPPSSLELRIENPGDAQQEAVIISNLGGTTDLTGWVLADERGNRFTFPPRLLFPGDSLTLHTRAGEDGDSELYWNRTTAAWQSGAALSLSTPDGEVRATIAVP